MRGVGEKEEERGERKRKKKSRELIDGGDTY